MIATQSGGYQGIGFALPINTAVKVYNDVIRSGRVTRGSIGISWNKQDKPELMRALGTNHGVLVSEVIPNGPAQKAGLKAEDIILSLNGKSIKDGDDLVNRVADLPVGSPATLAVDRSGKKLDFNLTIGDRADVLRERTELAANHPPQDHPDPPDQAKFGVNIRKLNEAERDSIGSQAKDGVKVMRVEPGSFADDIGVNEGDIIMSINRQPVTTVEDVKKIQGNLKPGSPVAFRILRNQQPVRGRPAQWTSLFVSGTLPPL
jgi:serine protease Do